MSKNELVDELEKMTKDLNKLSTELLKKVEDIKKISKICECGEPLDVNNDNICDTCENMIMLSKINFNYTFDEKDSRDKLFKNVLKGPIDPKYLPASVDLRKDVGKPLNQLNLGSCTSNSVAYGLRYCVKKLSFKEFNPSRLFIYYNGRVISNFSVKEDTGLSIRNGYKSVAKNLCCNEKIWPYVVKDFSKKPVEEAYKEAKKFKNFQYLRLASDILHLKKCLKDGYPISFGMSLFKSFVSREVSKTGIVPLPKKNEEEIGGHAMIIIGYSDDKKSFQVMNSWGEKWGDSGMCWIPYEYIMNEKYTSDFWSPRVFS